MIPVVRMRSTMVQKIIKITAPVMTSKLSVKTITSRTPIVQTWSQSTKGLLLLKSFLTPNTTTIEDKTLIIKEDHQMVIKDVEEINGIKTDDEITTITRNDHFMNAYHKTGQFVNDSHMNVHYMSGQHMIDHHLNSHHINHRMSGQFMGSHHMLDPSTQAITEVESSIHRMGPLNGHNTSVVGLNSGHSHTHSRSMSGDNM